MKPIILLTAVSLLLLSILQVQAQNQDSFKSGYAPVNGLDMYYEIHGSGEPLVLLHGSFMTIGMNYGQLIPELAKTNQVIAIELQGHGHTADIDRPFSYTNHARDVGALLDYLKIEKAHLLGYSLGATIALQTAIFYPEKVDKIVFISSVYKGTGWIPDVQTQLASMKPEYLTNTPLKTAYDEVAPDKAHWNEFLTRMITFENQTYDLGLENLKKLDSSILIINGDYDGVDVCHSLELFKAFGGGGMGVMEPLTESRLAIIPGTTHVTLMMQTNQLMDIISPFLSTKNG